MKNLEFFLSREKWSLEFSLSQSNMNKLSEKNYYWIFAQWQSSKLFRERKATRGGVQLGYRLPGKPIKNCYRFNVKMIDAALNRENRYGRHMLVSARNADINTSTEIWLFDNKTDQHLSSCKQHSTIIRLTFNNIRKRALRTANQ